MFVSDVDPFYTKPHVDIGYRSAPLLIPQVYKSHLTEGRAPSGPAVDSARQNLASTFVNAFVNAGFGQDKLMTVVPEGEGSAENVHWIFKNKVLLGWTSNHTAMLVSPFTFPAA